MPSFTIANDAVRDFGLVVPVKLTAASMTPTEGTPPIIDIDAMIDTGASHTAIRDDIPRSLDLNPVGEVPINTPTSTDVRCLQYVVRMIFPNNIVVNDMLVTAMPLQKQPIQCLIGRDILSQCVLIYNGYTNLFTLSF
ncbi:MAG: retroviral-like aspartic protease family protein [Candidatus Poribacteria bacterium]|nr:retroviral-like aspartic protease family protein [Candidatus Poribacteria bacterium]MDE0503159.1 retroviral-like aspartic protease family protein [Candidatus Poribacteria bacterium]